MKTEDLKVRAVVSETTEGQYETFDKGTIVEGYLNNWHLEERWTVQVECLCESGGISKGFYIINVPIDIETIEYASLRTSKLEKDLKDVETMFEKMELTTFNLEKRIKKLEELVGIYKKYAELLAESEGNLAAFAHTHRVTVDEKIVKKGIELRKQISELRKELGI